MIQYSAKSIREAKDVLSVFVHLGIEYNAFLDHPGDKGTITVKQESEWLFSAAPVLLAAIDRYFSEMEISDEGQRDIEGAERFMRSAMEKARGQ